MIITFLEMANFDLETTGILLIFECNLKPKMAKANPVKSDIDIANPVSIL